MCVHMSPGTEGVVDAKLVPVLVGKLLKEEDEIKVDLLFNVSGKSWGRAPPLTWGFLCMSLFQLENAIWTFGSSNQIFLVH